MSRAWRSVRASYHSSARRWFSASATRHEIRNSNELPPRISPNFRVTSAHDLVSLRWPRPPRNILLVRKEDDAEVRQAVVEFAKHVHDSYPDISIIAEPDLAEEIHNDVAFPIYTPMGADNSAYAEKVDLISTLGGDGTILHAASLYATARSAPPVLSFSMGTLGFLGEWNFSEHKRAFREAYVSGAPSPLPPKVSDQAEAPDGDSGIDSEAMKKWANLRGRFMGSNRNSRILMRSRIRIGLFDADGQRIPHGSPFLSPNDDCGDIFALNEVLLHRGALPNMAHITILIGPPGNERILTTAIADGFLVSTPTGSTAYSLSAGGSIVHPLVPSILLTPICPRSLSFRPLVLPSNTPITLRIDQENRGKEIEVSVDGVRRNVGIRAGMEVRVIGEKTRGPTRNWVGGVPSIVRSAESPGEDHWVGGLNSLLKFNYPFGEHI